MNLLDISNRNENPQPWAEGEKIPWNDPDFSQRMLREHLSQKHDAASRRAAKIKKQVDWIHTHVLAGKPGRILDLGCGPGLYASRLAAFGHTCHGIDFSPASVEYALQHAPANCTYALADLRQADFGAGYDLAMLIYGELNVFRPADARLILRKAFQALEPGGRLLLEVHTFDAVYELGSQPATWYSAKNELFAEAPHLCLMESFWDDEQSVAIERYYIVDAASGQVTRYSASNQAYSDDQYRALLKETGFQDITFIPSLTGKTDASQSQLMVILAVK